MENFFQIAFEAWRCGTFQNVGKDHLPLYLNKFSFRFKSRDNPDIFDAVITTCSK